MLCAVCGAVCSVWGCVQCVVLCKVSGGFVLNFTSDYKEFLSSCCHRDTLLLRKGTLIQNHVTEIKVAVLWGEHRAVW